MRIEKEKLPDKEEPPHYTGHRARLKERFQNQGAGALADYELLELLLFSAIPRRDVKPLAKALLAEFGGLAPLFQATDARLSAFQFERKNLGAGVVALLRVVGAAQLRAQQAALQQRPILSQWQSLVDYCQAAMAHAPAEQFRLLFLDKKWQLIADEVQQTGTIDHTPVYPREVARRALELGAAALILVHNHPSGDAKPSQSDISLTRHLFNTLEGLNIQVHDHIIVARQGCVSFKSLGLL